jgi:23S rRNA pseudouridine1911/1915/1917 synthase
MADRPVRFRVIPQEQGTALGALVADRLPNLSRREGVELVKAGAVYIGHLRVRVPSTRVANGDRITVYPDALAVEELDPQQVLRFVHRDPAFVVVDKPAGVPVAATKASARGTLSEALRRKLRDEGTERPYVGVVHRLDQGASGLVLFTVRGVANKSLHREFEKHSIQRTYRVRVVGETEDAFTCEAPLIEKPGTDSMQVAESGQSRAKSARTEFRRLTPEVDIPGTSLLEVTLVTGRTHQIRVHAAHCGHPVLGDRRYGDSAAERLHLHAWKLHFAHPLETGVELDLDTELDAWARGT